MGNGLGHAGGHAVTPPRLAGPSWPDVLVPAPGALPPALDGAPAERVLHVALRTAFERQPGLEAALRSIAIEYGEVDWAQNHSEVGQVAREAMRVAAAIAPTLVFLQLQTPGVLKPREIDAIRARCAPNVVIVNWDGDQHFAPADSQRAWFAELGASCDTSLVVNTQHPHEYAEMGVRHPGYLQIGTDARWAPAPPAADVPSVVLLAGCYQHTPAYGRRHAIVARLSARLGAQRFGVYGSGWTGACAHRILQQEQEAPVYSAAHAAISMSIRADLPRYTSDRLFRALAAGALVLVERFPDMAGLGLQHGVNCIVWVEDEDLEERIAEVLADPFAARYSGIRAQGAQLAASLHTWAARMPELLAIVEAVRVRRASA